MTTTTHSSGDSFYLRPAESAPDLSWYGTLGLLVACIGVLLGAVLVG